MGDELNDINDYDTEDISDELNILHEDTLQSKLFLPSNNTRQFFTATSAYFYKIYLIITH